MAPKRRKLSLDDSESGSRDAKRSNLENPTSDVNLPEEMTENSNDKLGLVKASSETSLDIKVKDDCLKPVRISERLSIKRNCLGDTEDTDGISQLQTKVQTPPKKPKAAKQCNKKNKKKIRRKSTQWSVRDKKLFFIGLGEFGKNFEAISNKISHAARVLGLPVKDKTQVRYFYYRVWGKISKFVHMKDSGVKMKTQELYGLVNYGVLKKYVTETDPQFERCLNELIHYGVTTLVSRVKRQRGGASSRFVTVRTPICTILKKLNRIEASEPSVSNKLPNHIILQLTPKNSKSWARVQALSQNPRVRMKVTANRTLESVFKYFDKKWKPRRARIKECLGAAELRKEELVFFLHPSCKLKPVTLVPQEQRRIDVTFKSYRQKILPTLLKSKKQRATKESDKVLEEKDEAIKDIPVDPGGPLNSDPSKSASNSAPEPSAGKTNNDSPSAFSCLLSAVGISDKIDVLHIDLQAHHQSTLLETDSHISPAKSSVLLEDENAMFPDDAPFSPPHEPLVSSQALNSPMIISPPPGSVTSPSLQCRRKSGKTFKRQLISDEQPTPPTSNCDNPTSTSDNSSSPGKIDCMPSASAQDLKDDSEKEITRLKNLVAEGFTLRNSNNVTLLHMSILLGRESTIKMEYEWRDKNPSKLQLPPLLCQTSNQMSNVLRRLCNIATLELSDFTKSYATDQHKAVTKSVPCSHCGRDATSKPRASHRGGVSERKMRETATMTDPVSSTLNHIQTYQPLPGLVTGGRTFVAAPSPGSIQIIGPDPVFRVPIVPTYNKPVMSKEEQQKLEEQQRLQAKEIMQQGPNPRRLLKRRTVSRKTSPSVIVQRSLVPKVDSGGMVTFLQQPLSKSVVVRMGPEEMVKSVQAVNLICSTASLRETNSDLSKDSSSPQVLMLSAGKSSEDSVDKSSISSTNILTTVQPEEHPILPSFSVHVTSTSTNLLSPSSPKDVSPMLTSQGDISISDFNISLSATTDCNMGPDAGDKFLDLVLPSEQGFSGLLSTPKKSDKSDPNQMMDSDISFGTPILRTPTHSGISFSGFLHTPIAFPSPLKLGSSNPQWIQSETGDISLSSILGDSSSFKSQNDFIATSTTATLPTQSAPDLNYAALFDNESSDATFSTSLMLGKSSEGNDISLSSLLGDPSFRKEDSQQRISPTLPLSSSARNLKSANLFSSTLDVESSSQLFGEGSQDSLVKLDVDGFVNDCSLDFVSKFEVLAAQISEKHQQDIATADRPEKLLITVDHMIKSSGTES
ncbi:hypothetical protein Btru_064897 [Bulinus truncatus]|nr:hypothetical protein Btru_064897 [Bulinus truncatus]